MSVTAAEFLALQYRVTTLEQKVQGASHESIVDENNRKAELATLQRELQEMQKKLTKLDTIKDAQETRAKNFLEVEYPKTQNRITDLEKTVWRYLGMSAVLSAIFSIIAVAVVKWVFDKI
jgi:hypothetical protein